MSVGMWSSTANNSLNYKLVCRPTGHSASVTSLAVCDHVGFMVSGSADGTVKVWKLGPQPEMWPASPHQVIDLSGRLMPLSLGLQRLDERCTVLAIGSSRSLIHIYASDNESAFSHHTDLPGHEGWIRSLAFTNISVEHGDDMLLASASHDKYIRLWRFHPQRSPPADSDDIGSLQGLLGCLSNKAYAIKMVNVWYDITFEALLAGHEDWIFSVQWSQANDTLRLLSASADNTLAIWEADAASEAWFCQSKLGEISVQRGSITATGTTGGFCTGLWGPGGQSVACLGRTGSWRLWNTGPGDNTWIPAPGVGGHVQEVRDVSWSGDGSYLLSASADQTTRLHAEWEAHMQRSWHEISRAQIHGYDINCLASLGQHQFVSGADEKLLRVFEEPQDVSDLLMRLCGTETMQRAHAPAASVPILGLSNKALDAHAEEAENIGVTGASEESAPPPMTSPISRLVKPPTEDHLARFTLWPEIEKLYGHGLEISAVAASHDHTLIATACKASALEHAVVRVFDTTTWHEVRPALAIHALTVTHLCFSRDDRFLLSVGRDRQWAVFKRTDRHKSEFTLHKAHAKAHSRMVLSAAWMPLSDVTAFVTGGRDKVVKMWRAQEDHYSCSWALNTSSAVTTLDSVSSPLTNSIYLAIGEESGDVSICSISGTEMRYQQVRRLPRE